MSLPCPCHLLPLLGPSLLVRVGAGVMGVSEGRRWNCIIGTYKKTVSTLVKKKKEKTYIHLGSLGVVIVVVAACSVCTQQ